MGCADGDASTISFDVGVGVGVLVGVGVFVGVGVTVSLGVAVGFGVVVGLGVAVGLAVACDIVTVFLQLSGVEEKTLLLSRTRHVAVNVPDAL